MGRGAGQTEKWQYGRILWSEVEHRVCCLPFKKVDKYQHVMLPPLMTGWEFICNLQKLESCLTWSWMFSLEICLEWSTAVSVVYFWRLLRKFKELLSVWTQSTFENCYLWKVALPHKTVDWRFTSKTSCGASGLELHPLNISSQYNHKFCANTNLKSVMCFTIHCDYRFLWD